MQQVANKVISKKTSVQQFSPKPEIDDPQATIVTAKSNPPLPKTFAKNFESLKKQVLKVRPILAELIEKHGNKNLYQYAKEYKDVNTNPIIESRKAELIDTLYNITEKRLGKDIAESMSRQLKKYYFVSTTDHHGPISHSYFLNTNLVQALNCMDGKDPEMNNVIALSCANISLNNSSYPRGILFQARTNNHTHLEKLPFSPAADRLCPVYDYHAYTPQDIQRVKKVIAEKTRNKEITSPLQEKLLCLIDEIYANNALYNSTDFSEQITKSNHKLWNKLFQKNNISVPNLIFIEQELLVVDLLVHYHLFNDTILNKMIFEPDYAELIEKYFEGMEGGFSRLNKTGTYLFWGLPKGAKYRLQLWRQGDYLISENGEYKIRLSSDDIKDALERKALIPSMLLTFFVLSFYYGLKCLGGFCQVNYLTFMKDAYVKMHAQRQNYKTIEACVRVQTKEFNEFTIAFSQNPGEKMSLATGIDLYLYGKENLWSQISKMANNITLEEALNPLMPEFYTVMCSAKDRKPELAAISSEQIIRFTGLDKKISPCIEIV